MITVEFQDKDTASYLAHISDRVLLEDLQRSDIVLLPEGVSPEESAVVFRPGAKEFFDYLSSQFESQLRVDIASEDDKYVEQLLHAADVWLPTLLLLVENPLMHELAIITVAHFILDKLRGLGKSHGEQTMVQAKILVNQKKGITLFKYNGPAASFEAVMKDAILGAVSKEQ